MAKRVEKNASGDPVAFSVKDLSARELRFAVGPGMRTLRDLRSAVEAAWQIPPWLQRLTTRQATEEEPTEWGDAPQDTPLGNTLTGLGGGGLERIAFLNFADDDNFVDVANTPDEFEFVMAAEAKELVTQRRDAGRLFR